MAELSISEPTDKTAGSYAAALESQGLVGGTIRRSAPSGNPGTAVGGTIRQSLSDDFNLLRGQWTALLVPSQFCRASLGRLGTSENDRSPDATEDCMFLIDLI